MKYIAYMLAWIVTGVVVICAIQATESQVPLLALVIPSCITLNDSNDGKIERVGIEDDMQDM